MDQCPRSLISDHAVHVSHVWQVLHSGEGCAERCRRCAIYNRAGKYRHSFILCLFAATLPASWRMSTFPVSFIEFRKMLASSISTLFPRSYQPLVAWPETPSTAAASLTIQTAGRPSWTPLSVTLQRSLLWTFSCFCVWFMVELTIVPEPLQRLWIQRGTLRFARFDHQPVSSHLSSDTGNIMVQFHWCWVSYLNK